MKLLLNLLILFILLLFSFPVESQIWAPQGATWHYSYGHAPEGQYLSTSSNVRLSYSRDTVLHGRNAKILLDQRVQLFDSEPWDGIESWDTTFTSRNRFISESGDTLFAFYDRDSSWLELYNLSLKPGDQFYGWPYDQHQRDTYLILETGVETISLDTLRYLTMASKWPGGIARDSFKIIEKIGSFDWFFTYQVRYGFSDPELTGRLLCYEDSSTALYHHDGFNCEDFHHTTAIENLDFEQAEFFPNPANNQLTIRLSSPKRQKLNIYDIRGVLILTGEFNKELSLDLSSLPIGVYVLELNDQIKEKLIVAR